MLLRKNVKAIIKQAILLLMPLAMLFSCLYDPISDDEIVFVSVGQGDCVHIRAEGHDVLIDGGGQAGYVNSSEQAGYRSSSEKSFSQNDRSGIDKSTEGFTDQGSKHRNEQNYNVGKNILMPYLMHGDADSVDMALVTHLHSDHYKGIEELSEVFPVGAIGVPVDYRESFKNTDAYRDNLNNQSDGADDPSADHGKTKFNTESKIYFIDPDSKIYIANDVYIEVLWPVEVSDEPIAADDPNEHNTVYMIHYKDIKVMVTGDLLEADEKEMIKYYQGTDTLECDILKVAHHGSKSSSSEAFLDAARPEIAVIQCGRNNFYGHPHNQTLERLKERGIEVFRTDLSGAVGIDIHKSRISIDLFRSK